MKSGEIVDAAIEDPSQEIVIELPNGDKIATTDYIHGSNKRGDPVLIIKCGRKLAK